MSYVFSFHNNERPFVCTQCGQRFVTSSHLSVHLKHHSGERNHICPICEKGFIRKEHLRYFRTYFPLNRPKYVYFRSHMTSHTGQKKHLCTLCGKRYAQSCHLSRHMKTHKIADEPTKTDLTQNITINQDQLIQNVGVSLLGV